MHVRTVREQLREGIRAGWSMDLAETYYRRGVIGEAVYIRFERLWIWSTATEHQRTRFVPLARWSARRERIRRAVRIVRETTP